MARNQFELNPDYVLTAGRTLSVLGTGLLITEAILGLFAIDIAVLICLSRQENRSSRDHNFLSGYLWGRMSRNHYSLAGMDLLGMGLFSFFQSLVAGLILSAEFAMPIIFVGILATWFGTLAMIALGKALESYGQQLQDQAVEREAAQAHVVNPPQESSDSPIKINDFNARFFNPRNPEPSAPPLDFEAIKPGLA